jgi:chemotaxis protein MotB
MSEKKFDFDDDHDEPDHHVTAGGHSEGEPWLVSYADLMTLLFGFFAMLFTFATFEDEKDKDKYVRVTKEVAKYFGAYQVTPIEQVAKELKGSFKNAPFVSDIDLKVSDNSLQISFISNILFISGNAEINPQAKGSIYVMIDLLKGVKDQYEVRVEGHTDDNPVHAGKFSSNWELSAARAAAVVQLFDQSGYPVDQIGAVGYGASRPAFPNRDPDGKPNPKNQVLNRRVVIKVLPLEAKQIPVENADQVPKDSHSNDAAQESKEPQKP